MKIRRVVPNLKGRKMPESRSFHEDVIGLELGMDMGWIMSFGSWDNATAQLSIERAVASGAEIVYPPTVEPWGVRRFFVRDPNGAVINVLTHVAKR